MYKELDGYLSVFFTDDYWYDEGFQIAREMLEEFSDNDWENLLSDILSKSIDWQVRFAYCVDSDINDEAVIKSLVLLCDIESEELFETCIDSLRVIVNSENIDVISNNEIIIQRVEKMLPKCGVATRRIFEDFITKVQE